MSGLSQLNLPPESARRDDVVRYGASFASSSNLLANAAQQIVAPAANTAGMIVWAATMATSANTVAPHASILAKASAPANVTDGDVLAQSENISYSATSGHYHATAKLARPVFVPAGKGLYAISTNAEAMVSLRSALYTLL